MVFLSIQGFFFLVVSSLCGLCAYFFFQVRRLTRPLAAQEPAAAARPTVRLRTSSATASPGQDGMAYQPARQHGRARVPFVFAGDAATFREWVFTVEMAMKSQCLREPSEMVDFAAMHLSGNACLWFLNTQDAGEVFLDWPTLKSALAEVFGPLQEQEQARLRLMGITQESSLEEYINLFAQLSLLLPDVDEHTKALLFVRGLREEIRKSALAQHPSSLSAAIRAARASTLTTGAGDRRESAFTPARRFRGMDTLYGRNGARPRRLTDEDRTRLMKENRCFACRQTGHMARECTRSPNGGRQ